jgi:hypothetical protein
MGVQRAVRMVVEIHVPALKDQPGGGHEREAIGDGVASHPVHQGIALPGKGQSRVSGGDVKLSKIEHGPANVKVAGLVSLGVCRFTVEPTKEDAAVIAAFDKGLSYGK